MYPSARMLCLQAWPRVRDLLADRDEWEKLFNERNRLCVRMRIASVR